MMSDDQLDRNLPFDELLIVEYLQDNPDFFARYPMLVQQLKLADPARGVVSLVERRQQLLVQKVAQLEEEITSLMSVAATNEKIYRFNNQLALDLLQCSSEHALKQLLASRLKAQYQFSHVELVAVDKGDSVLTELCRKRLQNHYYFGRVTQAESRRLFAAEVGSVALIKLKNRAERPFILAIASHSITHFDPDMDSLLLEQLKQVIDYLLPTF